MLSTIEYKTNAGFFFCIFTIIIKVDRRLLSGKEIRQMKKILIMVVLVVFILSFSVPALAKPSVKTSVHHIDVTMSSKVSEVQVGEEVTFVTTAPKHGSSYIDGWEGAKAIETVFHKEAGEYISTATFIANEEGVYTISYLIEMSSGKSGVSFSGTVSQKIEVVDNVTVTGAGIKNLIIQEVKDSQGNTIGFNAFGETYIIWSNNETTDYGVIYLRFGEDELSKDINVTVEADGNSYTYIVNILR